MNHRRLRIGTALLGIGLMAGLCVSTAVGSETLQTEDETGLREEFEEEFREEEVIGEIETMEFDPEEAPYVGEWVSFEEGFRIYVPVEWESVSVDDEMKESGFLYKVLAPLDDPEEDLEPSGINVIHFKDTGISTLSEAGEVLEDYDLVYNGLVKMNNIPCVAYTSSEGGDNVVVGIAFFDLEGGSDMFTVQSQHFEEMSSELMTVLMSVSAAE